VTNTLKQALLAFYDKRFTAEKLHRDAINPVLYEFHRLRAIVLRHAVVTGDTKLHRWVDGITAECQRKHRMIMDGLSEVEGAEIAQSVRRGNLKISQARG
jgi:hypothetical protein